MQYVELNNGVKRPILSFGVFQITNLKECEQVDYIDLYLIHQPYGDYNGSWRAIVELYKEEKIRALGVSNFYDHRLVDLAISNEVRPAISQRETHLYNQLWTSLGWSRKCDIQMKAWAPLGRASSGIFDELIIRKIADAHGKTLAQIILRWLTQRDIIAIPKSSHLSRMRENIDIFDFRLNEEEMQEIKKLDRSQNVDG